MTGLLGHAVIVVALALSLFVVALPRLGSLHGALQVLSVDGHVSHGHFSFQVAEPR